MFSHDQRRSRSFRLTEEQFGRIRPCLPTDTREVPRVNGRRGICSIVHVIRNGLRWQGAPAIHGPHKTLCNRFRRRAEEGASHGRRPAAEKRAFTVPDARGGLNPKLHVACDNQVRPLISLLAEGRKSDVKGAEHDAGASAPECRAHCRRSP